MKLSDYILLGFTIVVGSEKAIREIEERYPNARVMLASDDAIGGNRLLVDSYYSGAAGVMAAVHKFQKCDVVYARFSTEFVGS